MKRLVILLAGLIFLLLALLVAVVVLYKLHGKEMIRKGIVAGAQKALQVDVRLESVELHVLDGKADITRLQIDNPKEFKFPTFLDMGHASIDLDVGSLMSKTIKISNLKIDDIKIVIEQKGGTNNLKEILNNLPDSKPQQSQNQAKSTSKGKDIRIEVLEINNIQVQAKLLPLPGRASTVTFKLDPIRLENIGKDYRVDSVELTSMVIKAISKGILEAGGELLPVDMVASVAESLGHQGLEIIKTGTKTGQKLIKGVQKETTGVIKGFGGLLHKENQDEKSDSASDQPLKSD